METKEGKRTEIMWNKRGGIWERIVTDTTKGKDKSETGKEIARKQRHERLAQEGWRRH